MHHGSRQVGIEIQFFEAKEVFDKVLCGRKQRKETNLDLCCELFSTWENLPSQSLSTATNEFF